MNKPIPEQVRAYAEALIAWSEGKKVEYRNRTLGNSPAWWLFNGELFVPGFEYRIVPDPPKAREWWVNVYNRGRGGCDAAHLSKDEAENQAIVGCLECVHVREILDTEIVVNKAEYEELRRNEAAMKAALHEWLVDNTGRRLRTLLDDHGAKP
jgi:hypothetical protein